QGVLVRWRKSGRDQSHIEGDANHSAEPFAAADRQGVSRPGFGGDRPGGAFGASNGLGRVVGRRRRVWIATPLPHRRRQERRGEPVEGGRRGDGGADESAVLSPGGK